MRDRAADRAAVPHLRVADEVGRVRNDRAPLREQRVADDLRVAGERSDRDPVAVLAHVAQVPQPADVDEERRAGEAEAQERNERMTAGEQLRILVTPEQLDRPVEGVGPLVLEGGGDHVPALAAACTARTMLWYPVQRQRLPSSPRRISSSEGSGFSCSSETAAITNPGVQ